MRDRDRYPHLDRILFFYIVFCPYSILYSYTVIKNNKNDKGVRVPQKEKRVHIFQISVTRSA